MIITVDADNFAAEVEGSSGFFLLDFWGPACQPCLALMPFVEELAEERKDVRVGKLDSSRNRKLCLTQRVMNLPTFILYQDGKELSRLSGKNADAESIKAMLREKVR